MYCWEGIDDRIKEELTKESELGNSENLRFGSKKYVTDSRIFTTKYGDRMCPISWNRIYIATFFCRVCFIFDADRHFSFFSVSNEGEHSMRKKKP